MGTIPVGSSYLYAIRAQSAYTWRKMVCELVDNSFDANATCVQLSWPGGNVFSIEDDGIGCSDLVRMITLGDRMEYDSTSMGRYAVGAKYAMIWLWGRSVIETCGEAGVWQISADWDSIARSESPYPNKQEVGTRGKCGTKITCYGERNAPEFKRLIADLGNTYTPAIEAGKRIVVWTPQISAPRSLVPRRWPRCSEMIDESIEAAGRSVRIRMGRVSEGCDNTYERGFAFERDYRVICESSLGAGCYSTSRIAARITLGKEWELTTNKDDFTEFKDELAEAIFDRCSDLMGRASSEAMSIEDHQFNMELADIINEASRRRRERRESTGESCGTVEPKETGRRRERAAKTSDAPGNVLCDSDQGEATKRRRKGVIVDKYTDPEGRLTFGYYDRNANRVMLNYANEWLKSHHMARNRDVLLPVIYGIVSIDDHDNHNEKHPLFAEKYEDLLTQWGSAVANAADTAERKAANV